MTPPDDRRRLTVYSRRGCHLCDLMVDAVQVEMRGRSALALEIVDVDDDADLARRYGSKVPVLCVDGREICHYHLDHAALERALA